MNVIDTTHEEAEDALVALARHVPREVDFGRPLAAVADGHGGFQIITKAAGLWWLEPGDTAARLLPLEDGRVELTRWRDGVEVLRNIAWTD